MAGPNFILSPLAGRKYGRVLRMSVRMKQHAVMEVSKVEKLPQTDIRERIKVFMERKEKTPALLDVWLHVFVMARLNRCLNPNEKQRNARA